MPSKAALKRTIKLRQPDAQGREFVRVSPRNKTNWASCNLFKPSAPILEPGSPVRPTYGRNRAYLPQGGGDPNKLLIALLLAIFTIPAATFAFASLAAATASGGEVVLISIYSKAGEFVGFKWVSTAVLKGFLTVAQSQQILSGTTLYVTAALGFLSNNINTPELVNFNKPCDPVGRGKF